MRSAGRRFVVAMSIGVGLFLAPPPVDAAACGFALGFKALRDQIPETVGDCLEDEHFNPSNGNAEQRTVGGLLVWRKADNFTAFTDGHRSWVNGPFGLQTRLNAERFGWEEPAGSVAGPRPMLIGGYAVPGGGYPVPAPLRREIELHWAEFKVGLMNALEHGQFQEVRWEADAQTAERYVALAQSLQAFKADRPGDQMRVTVTGDIGEMALLQPDKRVAVFDGLTRVEVVLFNPRTGVVSHRNVFSGRHVWGIDKEAKSQAGYVLTQLDKIS